MPPGAYFIGKYFMKCMVDLDNLVETIDWYTPAKLLLHCLQSIDKYLMECIVGLDKLKVYFVCRLVYNSNRYYTLYMELSILGGNLMICVLVSH